MFDDKKVKSEKKCISVIYLALRQNFFATSLISEEKIKEKKKNTLGLQLSFTKDSGTQIVICKEWCEVANMAIAWVTQKFKTPCLRGFSVMDSHVEWQINNGEKNSRRRPRRLI